MRIAFICQAVDEMDTIQAGTVTWLRTLAGSRNVEAVFVVALRTGAFELPRNVRVYEIEGRTRSARLCSFYRGVFRALEFGIDCFFVYQSGPYPVLLLPLSVLGRKPIFQWRAHPHVPLLTRLNIFCDRKVFTSTPAALPLASPKVRVVGQGVDTMLFSPKPGAKVRDFVTVTRFSPSKGLDRMLRALASQNLNFGTSCTLDIYGPTPERDRGHVVSLERLVRDLRLSDRVSFCGPISQAEVPDVLSRYRVFLNFSDTALDRSVVEAMACGLPVLSTNGCVADILPATLKETLIMPRGDAAAQGRRMFEVMSMPETVRSELGSSLRKLVLRDHGIDALIGRILGEMAQDLR